VVPFKAKKMSEWEWESAGREIHNYPWRCWYHNESFRSSAEVAWAKAFDLLGLAWESEPLKFDMGKKHASYTPDFKVAALSIPGSSRPLYIEIKRFPDYLDLTKYVRFTEWYNCDLLVLAHYTGGVLKPKKEKHFRVLWCKDCNTYDCWPYDGLPADYYRNPNEPSACPACQKEPLESMVVPNYFLIQAGTILTGRITLPERGSSERRITYTAPVSSST
jgi:hypothetical protein